MPGSPNKKRLLSVTASDCRWEYYRGTGAGGQKRNKTSNCARCTHEPSGASAVGETGRSQADNRSLAFGKMARSAAFQGWIRNEITRLSGGKTIEQAVADALLNETVVQEEIDGEFVSNTKLAITKDDLHDIGLPRASR